MRVIDLRFEIRCRSISNSLRRPRSFTETESCYNYVHCIFLYLENNNLNRPTVTVVSRSVDDVHCSQSTGFVLIEIL